MSDPRPRVSDRSHRRLRGVVRGGVLGLAVLLLAYPGGPVVVPGSSPFTALLSLLSLRGFHAVALPGLLITGIVLLYPRAFCRWLCPLGLCADGASHLGRRCRRPVRRCLPAGQWVLWLTWGGALLGYPLLLWLDPLAIFTGLFSLQTTGRLPGAWLIALPGMGVLGLSFAWPHAWCTRCCPLGALQDLLSLATRRGRQRVASAGAPMARRAVLGSVIGALSAATVRAVGTKPPRPLRPPAAVDEPQFLGVCVRCGNCARVCPPRIIRPDLTPHGLASLMTPTLNFESGYCRDDCIQCVGVCPSGALNRTRARKAKRRIRMGLATVDPNRCLLAEDRECTECRRWCPYGAIRTVFSEATYSLTVQIAPDRCNGCGACEMACPTKPSKAITVAPL